MSYLTVMFAVAVLVASANATICKTSTSKDCYWTRYFKSGANVAEAESFCTSHGADLGVIYDEKAYDEIVEDARRELGENFGGPGNKGFWTGANYDPATNELHPSGAYDGNWRPGYPSSNPDATATVIAVNLNPGATDQGFQNSDPTIRRMAVVCWNPGPAICKTSTSEDCYWTKYFESAANVAEASSFCTSQRAYLGVIYDEKAYGEIVEDARRELEENFGGTGNKGFWTGANYDPVTNELHPSAAYNGNWRPGYPSANPDATATVIAVNLNSGATDQGFQNSDPTIRRWAVVCWNPGRVPDTCNEKLEDFLPDPTNPCSGTFYQCANGEWVPQYCPEDLKFNVESSECDYDYNVAACN